MFKFLHAIIQAAETATKFIDMIPGVQTGLEKKISAIEIIDFLFKKRGINNKIHNFVNNFAIEITCFVNKLDGNIKYNDLNDKFEIIITVPRDNLNQLEIK